MNYKTASYMAPMSLGKHFGLLLTAILALLLTACGGSDSGNNGTASAANKAQPGCTLTQDEIDALLSTVSSGDQTSGVRNGESNEIDRSVIVYDLKES